jgi:hypothetical protein
LYQTMLVPQVVPQVQIMAVMEVQMDRILSI